MGGRLESRSNPPDGSRARRFYSTRGIEVELVNYRIALVALCIFALFASHQAGCGRRAKDTQLIMLDSFVDGQWTLLIDRHLVFGYSVLPFHLTREEHYEPVAPGTTYVVVLSDQGKHISINPRPITGFRSDSTADHISFELTKWAGGRFIVWPGDSTLQAERTIYGSGVISDN